MVSIWWVLAAFVIGGYAGAVVVALMSMAHAQHEPCELRADAPGGAKLQADAKRRSHRQTPAQAHR